MNRFLVALFGLGLLAAGQAANAATITLSVGAGGAPGDRILGEVFIPGDIEGGILERSEKAIDGLRVLAPGTRTGTDPEYYRSTTDFGPLPDAVGTGALYGDTSTTMTGTSTMVRITLPTRFAYVMATYNGPNGGGEVWYIPDIAAGTILEIPRYARPVGTPMHLVSSNKYAITSWKLFNPDPVVVVSVPDGGTTALLLGVSMLGLGYLRSRKGR